ncbi:MAG: hypothetical protein TREMPRED_003577 [Tremellales sp. Tagirdzhanova-0007]|nr:MAG: hypothetical protein TREMPRED_003577 [Tremellales sp. Tagirdzhanova-0007]
MPRKAFLVSAAEESRGPEEDDTEPFITAAMDESQKPELKKRKRRGTRGRQQELKDSAGEVSRRETKQWSGAIIARRTKLSAEHSKSRYTKRTPDKHVATTCFACRSIGHAARDCPNVLLAQNGGEGSAETNTKREGNEKVGMKRRLGKKGGEVIGGRCYRCNAVEHSLSGCSEALDPINPTPFATCFICLASGHLSSLCASNQGRGIYVNGGSCKLCSSTSHRAKDCPANSAQIGDDVMERPIARRKEVILGNGAGGGADEDDFMVNSRRLARDTNGDDAGKGKRKKHPPAKNGERPRGTSGLVDDSDSAVNRSEGTTIAPRLIAVPSVRQAETRPKPKVINF